MKTLRRLLPVSRCARNAFTLVEMLVVIAMIGILASLLLAALNMAQINAKMKLTQVNEGILVNAIEGFYATYSRLPASSNAVAAAAGTTNDFTFGTTGFVNGTGQPISPSTAGQLSTAQAPYSIITPSETSPIYQANNSEVMAILRDDNFPPEATNNLAHIYNPQKNMFFAPRQSGVAVAPGSFSGPPGLGTDEVLRDVWGLPYMITLDLNYDGRTLDPYMSQISFNQSGSTLYGSGHAVVWSFGPFKKMDLTQKFNSSVNKYIVHTP